ncbi:MAG: hypothetical protein PHP98_10610, partial [Kiritimatiellae bacterium]|nr:hypothetical protein [Kiritimatiellia bacterium]
RPLYLDLAENIIEQACHWIDGRGMVVDPVEGGDQRWKGGTSARFACPAAILAREKNRRDFLPPAIRALDQVADNVLKNAAEGGDFLPGVLDLTMKEIVVAYDILREHTDAGRAEKWRLAIAAIDAEKTYKSGKILEKGGRLDNYGVSSCTGEWLRIRHGLADTKDYVDKYLELELAHFTEMGMYRDPGDPMLYDLMVRQNLTEMMHYGYDGRLKDTIAEILRRSGFITLLFLSPCGYAPFGGRSNGQLHNEAMLAYILEHQANCWRKKGRMDLASVFRKGALQAMEAVAPYAKSRPLRFIKNQFDPKTNHGKDTSYGEYANYALLAASLFARAALISDDTIPVADGFSAAGGCVFDLWPAFHKVFAVCGDSHVEIDTRAQAVYDATGLGQFHRKDAPPELALSMGIAADPKYIRHGVSSGRAAAIGPCWKIGQQWRSLAQMIPEIEDVVFTKKSAAADEAAWSLRWSFASLAHLSVESLLQEYRLAKDCLEILAAINGGYNLFGFEVPCLVTNGTARAQIEISDHGLAVELSGWRFRVELRDAIFDNLSDEVYANRFAHYRIARFASEKPEISARLWLEKR